jgi:hypothetical protein
MNFNFDSNLKENLQYLVSLVFKPYYFFFYQFLLASKISSNLLTIRFQRKVDILLAKYDVCIESSPASVAESALTLKIQLEEAMESLRRYLNGFYKIYMLQSVYTIIWDFLVNLDNISLRQCMDSFIDTLLYSQIVEHNGDTSYAPSDKAVPKPYTLVLDLDETLVHYINALL